MHQTQNRKFGLITAIAMIVGIVIGSGIFFKTDDILIQTQGNVLLGSIAWLIGATGIIFGGLTISEIASQSDEAGGIVTYIEIVSNKKAGFLTGWFLMIIYYPALTAIIAWVAALYTSLLFQIPVLSMTHWLLSIVYLLCITLMNVYATKLAGYFQSTTMFIKLVPLILIAIIGLLFGNPGAVLNQVPTFGQVLGGSSAAIISVAFAFDGWLVAPSICHEVKNAKRNIPLALLIGPLFIMVVYLCYFVGMSAILGPQRIMELGDAHIYEVATMIFGSAGAKIILVFVVISVLGTVNGLYLGLSRIPYALALRKDLPFSNQIAEVNRKYDMPIVSAYIATGISLLWLFIHYLSTKIPVLSKLDISNLPIVLTYIFYIYLYFGIIKLTKRGVIKSKFKGFVCPAIAICSAAIILYSGFRDPMVAIYLVVCIILIFAGLLIQQKQRTISENSN